MTTPPLFEIVDYLYNTVASEMPEQLQGRPMFVAPILGVTGAYLLATVTREVGHALDSKLIKYAEPVAKYGIPAAALALAYFDPEGAKQIVAQHPVYTAGMAGAYAGGLVATRKKLEKKAISDDTN